MVRPRGIALPGNSWSLLDGRVPEDAPLVSVIVAHFEQQAELDRTLLALSRQDHPAARLELIVVDDGSKRPPRVPAGVRLLVQEDRGFRLAAARNAGAREATGDILCFLDADTVPERSYIRELTRLPALAPDVVTVGRRRHADLASLPATAVVDEEAAAVELDGADWLDDAYARSHDLLDADDRSYRFVIGAVTAVNRRFFEDTGGFDEGFTSYGGEDWEWTYRAWLRGALLAHVPTAVAWHDGPEWSARDEATRGRKNVEAARLAELVPVPGSGFRGLRSPYADVIVTLPDDALRPDGTVRAEWLVTMDSLAADLPLAAFPDDPRRIDRVRLRLEITRPFEVAPGSLRGAVDRTAREGLAVLSIVDDDGRELCRIHSVRTEHRARRWQRQDLFPTGRSRIAGVEAARDDVDLEAYLGGWNT